MGHHLNSQHDDVRVNEELKKLMQLKVLVKGKINKHCKLSVQIVSTRLENLE